LPARGIGAECITERDKKIFRFLFDSKVATAKQIWRRFFLSKSIRSCEMRLSRLVESGWIKCSGHKSHKRLHSVYFLTARAYEDFVMIAGVNDRRRQLQSDSIDHDLTLADLRERFEKNSIVQRVLLENELQSSHEHSSFDELLHLIRIRSDAAVEILVNRQDRYWIPLEYESTLKSIERCKAKLREYYLGYSGAIVFFICKDETVLSRMKVIDRELSKDSRSKMYFALVKDVLSSESKLKFETASGAIRTFG
jgi:hypothetical protein